MRVFIALLLDAGITEQEIDTMLRRNPAKLLGLPEPPPLAGQAA
jgi:predicted metal-dependent phosphotriesterase family hydrolase